MADFATTLLLRSAVPLYSSSAASPAAVLAWERRAAIAAGILAGVAGVLSGVVAGVVVGVLFGVGAGVVIGVLAGVVAGVLTGVAKSFGTAWPWYEMARIWLALHHWLPWQLMDFLADAHSRGVLRQAGAVYQFRHIELQHRLANRP